MLWLLKFIVIFFGMVKGNFFSYLFVLVEVKMIVLNGIERELYDLGIVLFSV